jgi:branched-subunit amino acid transport protein
MTPFIVVAAVGVGSYLFRISMLVLAARVGLPPVIDRAARYAVPISFAALAAVAIAPRLTVHDTSVPPLAAVLAAIVAVRWTRSAHAALLVGMPTMWVLTALVQ